VEAQGASDGSDALAPDERDAMRAFLQRSEVRLSTIHRVATALLSGAGLMVLLPAIERDSVVEVLRALLSDRPDVVHLLLVVAVGASLAVPFVALWLVLRDLTRFYFHSNHLRHLDGDVFTPRFTLTGLRLPPDGLRPETATALDRHRTAPAAVELLVPGNDSARRRIDAQVAAYGGLGVDGSSDDRERAEALFLLAASQQRGLLEEVAKVEHGMARHVLGIQVIVLRYAKALLALLTTTLSAFGTAAVVQGHRTLSAGDEAWLAAILLVWAPVAIAAVTSPIRWLEGQLRSEGAVETAVARDPELTRVEVVTVRLALVGFAAAAAAMATVLVQSDVSGAIRVTGGLALAGATAALVVALASWSGRPAARSLVGI
jgi:hypothetical protein